MPTISILRWKLFSYSYSIPILQDIFTHGYLAVFHSTDAAASPIQPLAAIAYTTPQFDPKGIGGSVDVFNPCENVQVLIGDVNGDGVVDFLDISPFVDLIGSGNYQPEADVNCDGVVDRLDVCSFVDLLI